MSPDRAAPSGPPATILSGSSSMGEPSPLSVPRTLSAPRRPRFHSVYRKAAAASAAIQYASKNSQATSEVLP